MNSEVLQKNKTKFLDKEARASFLNVKGSARKITPILKMIRNVSINKALERLMFCPRKNAIDVIKTLQSAVSNAENNYSLNADRLYVKLAYCTQANALPRTRARAKGKGGRIYKHFSHINIVLSEPKNLLRDY